MRKQALHGLSFNLLGLMLALSAGYVSAQSPSSEAEETNDVDMLERIEALHDRTEGIISQQADWLDERLNSTIDRIAETNEPGTIATSDQIDNFFGSPSVFTRMNTTRVQVSPSILIKQDEGIEPNVSFGANLELPLAEERFHLFFDNIDGEMINPNGMPSPAKNKNSENAFGVLLKLYDSEWLETHLTFGTRKVYYPYARYTITARWERGPWMLEPSQELLFRTDDGWEETTGFTANRKLSKNRMLRSDTSGVWGQESNGYEMNQTFSFYSMKNIGLDEAGYSASFAVDGHVSGNACLDNYTLNVKFRRRLKWDWLFLEIKPEVEFPHDRDYDPVLSLELQMDIIFQQRGPVISK